MAHKLEKYEIALLTFGYLHAQEKYGIAPESDERFEQMVAGMVREFEFICEQQEQRDGERVRGS